MLTSTLQSLLSDTNTNLYFYRLHYHYLDFWNSLFETCYGYYKLDGVILFFFLLFLIRRRIFFTFFQYLFILSIFFYSLGIFYSPTFYFYYFLLSPLLFILILLLIPTANKVGIMAWGLTLSIIIFFFSLIFWNRFNPLNLINLEHEFIYNIPLVSIYFEKGSLALFLPYNTLIDYICISLFHTLNFTVGVDGISIFFILLTTFIFPLCIISSWSYIKIYRFDHIKLYLVLLFFLEFFILNTFCVTNLFYFFIFFEATLIPMILLIGIFGPTSRKIKAIYYLVFYTLTCSILFFWAILILISEKGFYSLNYASLCNAPIEPLNLQLSLWFCFFLSFASKMPIFPFHIWLPEAHVEAPTTGSVILAALLLKLGGYGFIRFLPLFTFAYIYFTPLMFTLGVISIWYASLITIRQIDLKKIIAYSSVAHMNLGTVGIFSFNYQGIQGSIFLMLSHGIVSSALFFLVGILYDRYYTKFLKYYGGLVVTMPTFSFFFLFFSLANLAFPGTSNFIGEFLILIGISEANLSIMVLAASGMLFSSIYSIWLFNRLCFGNPQTIYIFNFIDILNHESFYLLFLTFLTLLLGICPDIVLNFSYISVKQLINH